MMQGFSDCAPPGWDNRPVSPEELYPTWPLASPFRLPEPQIHRCHVQGLHGGEWRHGLSDNGRDA